MAATADPMDELNHRLIHERDELTETLGILRTRAREELSPRRQIRRHFGAAIATCIVAGLVLGLTVAGWFRSAR